MTPFSSCPPPPKGTFRRTTETTRKGRRIVVGLHKGDLISVREENTATVYYVEVGALYAWAEFQEAKRATAQDAPMRRSVSRGKL